MFDLTSIQREAILDYTINRIEKFYNNTRTFRSTPFLDIEKIRGYINQNELEEGGNYEDAIDSILEGLEKYSVHTSNPKYFGLFNPRSNFAGIVADLITASYNPQLAAWSHAPFAVEVEAKLIREFAYKFGYDQNESDGVFCTGGAEANLTAISCALVSQYPRFGKEGVFGIAQRPIIYCSEEAHHSVQKAAKIVGLGYDSVKTIPVTNELKLDVIELEEKLSKAGNMNDRPLMLIGTGGTTGTGAIDDLLKLKEIAKKYDLWFHVDAAYGGASIFSQQLNVHMKGIEFSDSITFDAHKWMSVPMGASVFLTSNKNILGSTFGIQTEYMPKEASKMEIVDPFNHSIQWSRRFIGLKVYLSLLLYGWDGYEKVIDNQAETGRYLKSKLKDNGWSIMNNTPLPVACFTDEKYKSDKEFTKSILNKILESGKSWLSVYPINGIPTFRVCITNYNTDEEDINELIDELNQERDLFINHNVYGQ